ncbi:MAG TPA: hypothetical protein ENK70_03385 [Methylophaga sp.]|nr:hypothetical protein [Methylophaga sp.]
MPPSWVPIVQAIINGESIDSIVTNRPLNQLAERTEYLNVLFNTTGLGRGAFDFDAPMAADVYEGAAIYWDGDNKEYALALAAIAFNEAGNYGSYADSSYAVGICVGKTTSVRGIVALNGRIDGVDFSTSIGGAVQSGPYYVSMTTPGAMTLNKPTVGVLAMFGMESESPTSGSAIVMTTFKNLVEDHIHYVVDLDTATDVSGTTKGWVAAGNAIFNGLAPAGAVYGYNIGQDDTVNDLFPFVPASSVAYELDGIGSQDKISTDNNGIWWMDAGTDPDDSTLIRTYFIKMVSKTNNTSVTSLTPGADQPIKFVNCNGTDATTGDLYALLNLVLTTGGATTAGWEVFKQLTSTNQFLRGPVVESIQSDTLDISIREVDGVAQGANLAYGDAGQLLINYTPAELGREGDPSVTALYNAMEEAYASGSEEIPYIALPQTEFSRVSYQFNIPTVGLGSPSYTFTFWAWILATIGAGGGTDLPTLLTQYKIVSKADGVLMPSIAGAFSADVALTYVPDGSGMVANQYVLGRVTGITVEPGDQVYILVNRNKTADDGYAGNVGILRAGYSIA